MSEHICTRVCSRSSVRETRHPPIYRKYQPPFVPVERNSVFAAPLRNPIFTEQFKVPASLPERGTDTLAPLIPIFRKLRDSIDPLCRTELYQTIRCAKPREPEMDSYPGYDEFETWFENGVMYQSYPLRLGWRKPLVLTDEGIVSGRRLARFKCSVAHCSRAVFFVRHPKHPFPMTISKWCRKHGKVNYQAEVILGRTYASNLPPELAKHVSNILNDPEGMAAREELALAKALTARVAKILGERAESFDDPKHAVIVVKMLETVTRIAKTQAEVAEKNEKHLNYKQVIVLISATVEAVLRLVGKADDPRTTLLTIMPDLPWPSGVARVHGAEGLIGEKGQLLLPAKPAEKKWKVDAGFEGLDEQYVDIEMPAPQNHEDIAAEQPPVKPLPDPAVGLVTADEKIDSLGPTMPDTQYKRKPIEHNIIVGMDVPDDGFLLYEDPVPGPTQLAEEFRAPQPDDILDLL